jgi:prephenate dehydratase
MKVAYQGQPGAFGHQACLAFLPDHEPVAKHSFGAVLEAVTALETTYGMLPLENSCAGRVEEVWQLLATSDIERLAEHRLPVRMHLLAPQGTRLESVRRVVSHPVALAQCAETLGTLGLAAEPASNTAAAAKRLAEASDGETAVLASEAAASIYGLTILRRDVHDRPDNATTFCVVGRRGS